VHSEYLSVAEFINQVLRSFAADAPADSLLVFKKHPLDPGAVSYETLVRLEACSLGIRERIFFLNSGNLPALMQDSQGVIVVNSTVGTSALHHGKPTIALGKAVYDLPGLTWQGGLERFWTEAEAPDRELYRAFRSGLTKSVLINGGFFTPRGRRLALDGALQRFQTWADKDRTAEEPKKVVPFRKAAAGDRYSDSA
jgi:capsular polysaccharide export protein